MSHESNVQVTCEEVARGRMPEWLISHLTAQSLGLGDESGHHSRLLVLYPTETSRRQALSEIQSGHAVDKTLHHTIASLRSSLLADLRVPRLLSTEAPFEVILHEECARAASELAFPLINPLPEMRWGRGKTAALSELHSYLCEQSATNTWSGPGIASFRRVITDLEKRLGGTHPDLATQRVIRGLENSDTPFTLLDVDGIVMLDHPPGLQISDIDMLLALSCHRPIHQLTHPGNFRLGHHGLMLVDEHPITEASQLPDWIPPHQPDHSPADLSVTRLFLQREEHSFDAAVVLASERLEASPDSKITIIDPALDSNLPRWSQRLKSIGIEVPRSKAPSESHPLGHWIGALANLPHGPDAFCLQALRSLAIQSTINLFEVSSEHSSNARICPVADPDVLTRLARDDHVLGGPGTLERWLRTLSRPVTSKYDHITKESTQWWLLCLAQSLRPLLNKEDLKALSDETILIGCETGEILQLPEPAANGDGWLNLLLRSIDLQSLMEPSDGEGTTPAAVAQAIIRDHRALRSYQSSLGLSTPETGPDWVEEFDYLLSRCGVEPGTASSTERVSLLTPAEALGCTADCIIMANLSSASWDLSVPRMAFLGEEERHSEGLLRPDGPIRDARHYLESILASANEVILLDPSPDDTSPPAAPLREWATANDAKNEAAQFTFAADSPLEPRGERRLEGAMMNRMIAAPRAPLNPDSVTIPLDASLQRDRERRQPKHTDEDGYLPNAARSHLLSAEISDFSRTTPAGVENPRSNQRWPVIGGFTEGGKRTPSIDYRPLTPVETGTRISDARHGHLPGAGQTVEVWSPSRLHDWLRCPRMGWLSNSLRADQDERQSEDLDPRTHGELLHLVHHDIICNALGMEIGVERKLDDAKTPLTVSSSGLSEDQMMRVALESLDSRAPWLDRTDAVSNHRLRILTGLERSEWNDWLANPADSRASGRIGTIVRAEAELSDAAPLCLEWNMSDYDEKGISISVPSELSGENLPPIRMRGLIDRVDALPMDETGNWVNQDGDQSVAPLRLQGTGWTPRRLIAIRDLKTSESKTPEERHSDGLLQELQLALYARAWEIAHPGDLVVAAGISLFSHETEHMAETSSTHLDDQANIGTRTAITAPLFRFIDEPPSPNSDHFRAWLTHRLTVALRTALGAAEGRVHPTPSEGVCAYCSVSDACDVRMEGRF